MAATVAFREEYITSPTLDAYVFESYEARQSRYSLNWASYENTMYRNIHTLHAQALRNRYGLYRYIRNIYNPTHRDAEFWQMMLWGGLLDNEAGDAGAIPIRIGKTADEKLREAIALLWKKSNWNVNKGVCTLRGSVLGDTAIRIVDDPDHSEVRMELVHPSTIAEVDVDKRGFVQSYKIVENRMDEDGKKVTYIETAERGDGETVQYATYKNEKPFAWNGVAATWKEEYGFIPLVLIQHNNVGLDWGWAEMHAGRQKIMELDDLASKLHDHIRKMVDPIWLANFNRKDAVTAVTTSEATTDRPQPGREELQMIYVPKADAKAQPMVVDGLDISKVAEEIQNGIKELERDYPELREDIFQVVRDGSAPASREARQKVEMKVISRRSNYDIGLVRAQQMAIAIGGERGYAGFEGYNLQSYAAGKLEHTIPDRPIFDRDPMETLQERKTFWETVDVATRSGNIQPETVLQDLGWDKEKLGKMYTGQTGQ